MHKWMGGLMCVFVCMSACMYMYTCSDVFMDRRTDGWMDGLSVIIVPFLGSKGISTLHTALHMASGIRAS